jgi:hypothetical protein
VLNPDFDGIPLTDCCGKRLATGSFTEQRLETARLTLRPEDYGKILKPDFWEHLAYSSRPCLAHLPIGT